MPIIIWILLNSCLLFCRVLQKDSQGGWAVASLVFYFAVCLRHFTSREWWSGWLEGWRSRWLSGKLCGWHDVLPRRWLEESPVHKKQKKKSIQFTLMIVSRWEILIWFSRRQHYTPVQGTVNSFAQFTACKRQVCWVSATLLIRY